MKMASLYWKFSMFGKEGTVRAFAGVAERERCGKRRDANNEEGEYVDNMGSWESSGRDAGSLLKYRK